MTKMCSSIKFRIELLFSIRDGGELNIGGFVTPESHKDMVANVTPVTSDQGDAT